MAFLPHYINIYDNPLNTTKSGAFLGRYLAHNYKHTIRAMGWFDAAECELAVRADQAERIFEDYIGARVSVYVDTPEAIFEGFVERITYQVGNVVLTRSLENMQNRVAVTFYSTTAAAQARTSVYNNTAAQALYGVKAGTYRGSINYAGADISSKNALRDTRGSLYSYPQVSTVISSAKPSVIRLNIKGFYHMFDWEEYYNTATGTRTASGLIERFISSTERPTNSDLIYDTDATTGNDFIETNASFNIDRQSKTGQTYWEMIQQVAEGGDGTNQWLAGITPLDLNTGRRSLYYRQANTETIYVTRATREIGVIRAKDGGRIIDPWRVRPDCKILVADILPFYIGDADVDPRLTYIDAVEYDAENQLVTLQSGDDATIDGAFKFNRYFKRAGVRFGAERIQRP